MAVAACGKCVARGYHRCEIILQNRDLPDRPRILISEESLVDIALIYARFAADTDTLYRRAMALAARHRVLRVHHLLQATLDRKKATLCSSTDGSGHPDDQGLEAVMGVLEENRSQLARMVEQEAAGCLDTPMTNSPTMRRVLQSAASDAGSGQIVPRHLVSCALARWSEETPSLQLSASAITGIACDPGTRDTQAPSVAELEEMIGPPVSDQDIQALRAELALELDPQRRAWLAYKLYYLLELG